MRKFALSRHVAACLAVAVAGLVLGGLQEAKAVSPWLSTASSMSCARDAANQMTCWGAKGLPNSTLMRGGVSSADGGATVIPSLDVRQVAVGYDHACAIVATGAAQCWGKNGSSELGNGTTIDSPAPVRLLAAGSTATGIAVTQGGTCATTPTNQMWCAGEKNRIGLAASGQSTVAQPVPMPDGVGVQEVAMGPSHGCAVLVSGRVACWGANGSGQLGNGTLVDSATPVLVSKIGVSFSVTDLPAATDVAVGTNHTCALLTTSHVACWGANGSGQLGDGTVVAEDKPVLVTGISDAVEVAVGGALSCARRSSGSVACWGTNANGALGTGSASPATSTTPVAVLTVEDAAAIAVGPAVVSGSLSATQPSACALRLNGTVSCWGTNVYNELGRSTVSSSDPTPGAVTGVDGPAPPGAPTITSTTVGDGSIAVTWEPSTSATWEVTGFTATAGPDGGTCSATAAERTCAITGLRNGRSYAITVVAANELGTGAASTAVDAVPGVVPAVPAGVSGELLEVGTRVSWNAVDGYGNAVLAYEARIDDGGACTTDAGGRSCTIVERPPGATLRASVRAKNDIGWSAWSAPISFNGLHVPTAPIVTDVIPSDQAILVAWSIPNGDGAPILEYEACAVRAAPIAVGATWSDVCLASGGVTCRMQGARARRVCLFSRLENGTRYRIAVHARSSAGWGALSTDAIAVPVRLAPATPATADGDLAIRVACAAGAPCAAQVRIRLGVAPFSLTSKIVRADGGRSQTVLLPLPASLRDRVADGARFALRIQLITRAGRPSTAPLAELAAPSGRIRQLRVPMHLLTRSIAARGMCVGHGIQRCTGYLDLMPPGRSTSYGQIRFSVTPGNAVDLALPLDAGGLERLAANGIVRLRPVFILRQGAVTPQLPTARFWNITPPVYQKRVDAFVAMQMRSEFLHLVRTSWRLHIAKGVDKLRNVVLPAQRASLEAAKALPNSSPTLNRARGLLIRSGELQVRSTRAYLKWFDGGTYGGLTEDRDAHTLRTRALQMIAAEVAATRAP